jgi:nucleoside diphosphate kinase
MFQRELLREEITNLFYRHEGKPYFEDILRYMQSGESTVMVLVNAPGAEGDPIAKWKKLIGPSNPDDAKKTAPDSLRGKYGKSLIRNEFHGSDNLVEANKERKIFQFRVPQEPPQFADDPYKLTLLTLKQFLRPPNLEHSSVNERMDLLATYGPVVDWHSIEQCLCINCKPLGRQQAKTRKMSNGLPPKVLKEAEIRAIWDQLCPKCHDHCSGYRHLVGGREMQHLLTDV